MPPELQTWLKVTSAKRSVEENFEVLRQERDDNWKIDNTRSVFILEGSPEYAEALFTALPVNVKHFCHANNKITCDTYYLIKHIVFSICKQSPQVRDYLKLWEPNPDLEELAKVNDGL